jgi:hypothetical protein
MEVAGSEARIHRKIPSNLTKEVCPSGLQSESKDILHGQNISCRFAISLQITQFFLRNTFGMMEMKLWLKISYGLPKNELILRIN